jgi:hypothetical protein
MRSHVPSLDYGRVCLRKRSSLPGALAASDLRAFGKRFSVDSLLAAFVRTAAAAKIEEDSNPGGRPMFTLFISGALHWIIAVPGTGIPGQAKRSDIWRWRIHDYRSQRQARTDLSTITDLLPAVEARAHELHRRVIDQLAERLAAGEAELDVHLERLRRELQDAQLATATCEKIGWKDRLRPHVPGFQSVRVSWKPALGMAAESGEGLKAGDEREGRFRVVLSPLHEDAWDAVEVDVDVKRSLVTLHTVDERASLSFRGQLIGTKLSIPVSDREDAEDASILRLGHQLSEELERVVSVG